MKRCSRCILPETVPGISFNNDNVCSFCQDYEKDKEIKIAGLENLITQEFGLDSSLSLNTEAEKRNALEKIFNGVKKQNKKYDCLVGLSGGRDSTYVLYVARKIYKLNVLAFNWDNGFQSEQAMENMRTSCKILNVDFVSVPSKNNLFQKIQRYGAKATLKNGPFPLVRSICTDCTWAGAAAALKYAAKYDIPMIIYGQSFAEATEANEYKALSAFNAMKAKKRMNINWYKQVFNRILLRFEFHVPGNKYLSLQLPVLEKIKRVILFYYIPWDRKKIKETISRELDWKIPPESVSSWRFDCRLHPLINSLFISMLGCSKDAFGYTNMINEKNMTRQEALAQEEKLIEQSFSEDLRNVLRTKMGLSQKEIDTVFSYKRK